MWCSVWLELLWGECFGSGKASEVSRLTLDGGLLPGRGSGGRRYPARTSPQPPRAKRDHLTERVLRYDGVGNRLRCIRQPDLLSILFPSCSGCRLRRLPIPARKRWGCRPAVPGRAAGPRWDGYGRRTPKGRVEGAAFEQEKNLPGRGCLGAFWEAAR